MERQIGNIEITVCPDCKGMGAYDQGDQDCLAVWRNHWFSKCNMCGGSGRVERIVTIRTFTLDYTTNPNFKDEPLPPIR